MHVLEQLGHPKVLVLGDLILDRYTWGDAERISQEAPVIVLRADRREARLGGAANVANMLAGLEARRHRAAAWSATTRPAPSCGSCSVDAGADCELVRRRRSRAPPRSRSDSSAWPAAGIPARSCASITRTATRCASARRRSLIERVAAQVPQHDALLISDYGKGVCTPRLLKAAIEAANRAGVPVMVDPSRACPLDHYRGATVIKPNRLETELATGRKIAKPADALAAGRQLCHDLAARDGPDHARSRRHDAGTRGRHGRGVSHARPQRSTTLPAPATW